MYKHSTQLNHAHILKKHLIPRFGASALSAITTQDVQAYIAELARSGYAPKTIDHLHDVLSAVMRTAVKWGHLQQNPTRDVELPALRTVRPKWIFTPGQAKDLLESLARISHKLVGRAFLSRKRDGESSRCRTWKIFEEKRAAAAGFGDIFGRRQPM